MRRSKSLNGTGRMKQFSAHCKGVHHVEANLATLGNTAFHAALQSSGRAIQTNDGTQWQHGVDLMENTSIHHRRTGADFEFAVVEFVPMKSGEAKNVLMNSDHSVRELLKTFVRDEQQLLGIWKNDIVEEVKEHLAEKYPNQDMSIVAGSFETKFARAISEKPALAQNHSRGMRI
ncbi:MAG TPA: hypothetical protein VHY30_01300 [Verrucomicrobiae bacterium]|nr:hypothetical protein [Verrucomicrobiae bacterium]